MREDAVPGGGSLSTAGLAVKPASRRTRCFRTERRRALRAGLGIARAGESWKIRARSGLGARGRSVPARGPSVFGGMRDPASSLRTRDHRRCLPARAGAAGGPRRGRRAGPGRREEREEGPEHRLRPRRDRQTGREAGAHPVQGPPRPGPRLAAPDQLRPVARHPLPARVVAVARARTRTSRCSSSTPASSTTAPCRSTRSTRRASTTSRFTPNQFDYGENDFASRVPQDLGFAGFRVHYPIKQTAYKDEVIVFLGASYFRAVGKQHVYGLSARGARHRHRAAVGRGVPVLPGVLAGSAGARREGTRDLRAARQPAPDRRLSLRGAPGRRDARRRREPRLPAQEASASSASRRSPACSSSARTRCRASRTTGPRSTTPTAC